MSRPRNENLSSASYSDRQFFTRNPGVEVRERPSVPDEIARFIQSGMATPGNADRIYRTTVTKQGKGVVRKIVVREYVLAAEGVA